MTTAGDAGLQPERTRLAQRRTLLSLLANAALLAKLGAVVGFVSAGLVLLLTLWLYSSPRHLLPPEAWCALVAAVSLVDAVTIVVWSY